MVVLGFGCIGTICRSKVMRKLVVMSVALTLSLASPCFAELPPSDVTQVVMLGTGTPNADPERSGPAVANVRVEAFRVRHGTWPNAFGYRFTTPDRVIVISGDAAPDEAVEQHAKGADILIHEVYSVEGFRKRNPYRQKYHSTNHTSTHELGELASRAKPKLLVLYHVLFWGSSEETVLREVREKYAGEVVLADDLDVF